MAEVGPGWAAKDLGRWAGCGVICWMMVMPPLWSGSSQTASDSNVAIKSHSQLTSRQPAIVIKDVHSKENMYEYSISNLKICNCHAGHL